MKIPDWLYTRLEPHMIELLRRRGWLVFERAVLDSIEKMATQEKSEHRMTKLELDAAKSSRKPGLWE